MGVYCIHCIIQEGMSVGVHCKIQEGVFMGVYYNYIIDNRVLLERIGNCIPHQGVHASM